MLTKSQIENKITRLQIKIMDDLEEDGNIRAEHFGHSHLRVGHPGKTIQVATVYNKETRDFDFIVTVIRNTKKEIVTTLAGERMIYHATAIIRNYVKLYDVNKNYTGFLEGV
ncbi:distal tail protein [Bacillus phage SWEP1]|nr:distal tail protein [Bacillus phage SWEP1]